MVKIFPYDERVISTLLSWINTTKRDELSYATIVHPAERFVPLVDQEVIEEEFEDYQLVGDVEIVMEEDGV